MRQIPQDQKTDNRIDISVYWRVFRRRKHYVIIPLVVAAIVATVGARFLTPMYASSTVIRMEDRGLFSKEVAQVVQLEDRRRMHDSEILARMRAEIYGSAFLDRAIRHLGLDTNPDVRRKILANKKNIPHDLTAEEIVFRALRKFLSDNIELRPAGPSMFRITFFDYSAAACYVVANALADQYIEQQQLQRMQVLQQAGEFSDEQLSVYKERLEKSEKELADLRVQFAEKQRGTIAVNDANVRDAEALLQQISVVVDDREEIVERLRQNLDKRFGAVPSEKMILANDDLASLRKNLIARREGELLLEINATPRSSPEFTTNQDDISEIQANLQQRLGEQVRSSYTNASADYQSLIVEYFFQLFELESLQQKIAKLRFYVDSYYERIQVIPQMERRIAHLQGTVETNRTLYNTFLSSKTAAQIGEAAESTKMGAFIEVVEPARKPLTPVKPNKMKILLVSLLFSGLLGIGALLLVEMTDTSLENVDEVERVLGYRVLGTVPRLGDNRMWGQKDRGKRAVIWVAASVVITAVAVLGFYYYGKLKQTEYFARNAAVETRSAGSSNAN